MSTSDELLAILPLIQRFVGTQPDALERIHDQIRTELEYAEANVRQAKAQLAAIEQVIANLEKAPPQASVNGATAVTIKPVNAPPLRKAIKIILSESSPEFMKRGEILAELDRRGWGAGGKTPRNTVISRLSELVKDGTVKRAGDEYWMLPPEETEADQQRLP